MFSFSLRRCLGYATALFAITLLGPNDIHPTASLPKKPKVSSSRRNLIADLNLSQLGIRKAEASDRRRIPRAELADDRENAVPIRKFLNRLAIGQYFHGKSTVVHLDGDQGTETWHYEGGYTFAQRSMAEWEVRFGFCNQSLCMDGGDPILLEGDRLIIGSRLVQVLETTPSRLVYLSTKSQGAQQWVTRVKMQLSEAGTLTLHRETNQNGDLKQVEICSGKSQATDEAQP